MYVTCHGDGDVDDDENKHYLCHYYVPSFEHGRIIRTLTPIPVCTCLLINLFEGSGNFLHQRSHEEDCETMGANSPSVVKHSWTQWRFQWEYN